MITVLYVDADPVMIPLITRIFERSGNVVVHPAVSGEEALEWLSRYRADVIVSDLDLPGIDGMELLSIMRSRRITAPFIFFTSYFIEPLKNRANYPDVFRFNGRNGPDKKSMIKLLRIVCWVTGNHEKESRLHPGVF